MNMPLVLLNRRRRGGPAAFSPTRLFALAEPGVWYDPSDVANLDWRRNLLTWTEQFDNAAWGKLTAGDTVTANAGVAPDSTTTAENYVPNTTNTSSHIIRQSWTAIVGQPYVMSVYAKANGYNWLYLSNNFTTPDRVWFNLQTGSVGTVSGGATSATMTSVGNGWYRCSFVTANASSTGPQFQISTATSDGSQTFAGDGTSGILIWGAQLELGSTITDYQRISDVNTEVVERFPTATLYQDTAGTQPVTTPGQTVALALDKSKGLVLGSELVTNGDFSGGSTGWTVGTNWVVGSGAASKSAGASGNLTQAAGIVSGRFYKVSFDLTISGGNLWVNLGANDAFSNVQTTSGRKEFFTTATGANGNLQFQGATNVVVTIDNISVRELPGNHATQATAASRPTYGIVPLGGRRNLLTRTEEFNDAVWTKAPTSSISANSTLDPNGTLTADTYSQTSGLPYLTQGIVISAAGPVTASIRLKKSVGDHIRIFVTDTATLANGFGCWVNISNPASPSIGTTGTVGTGGTFTSATVSDLGDGWCVVRLSGQAGSATSISLGMFVANADNSGTRLIPGSVFLWGAQLETGSTATAYQRVGSAFDVTEAGVASLSYLSFDGVDDFLVTPTITPGIDKAQVFAGVRKLSDAAIGEVVGLSTTPAAFNGSFFLRAPSSIAANYQFRSRGTTQNGSSYTNALVAAPVTNVLVGIGDISGPNEVLRVNSVAVASSTLTQGTGNYLAYPLYIGRTGGASNAFNGNLFSLIVRFGANLDAGTITSTETWVNQRTGAF